MVFFVGRLVDWSAALHWFWRVGFAKVLSVLLEF